MDPVLADPEQPSYGFVRMQCLSFFYYYVPFHAWAAHRLLFGERTSDALETALADWSTIFAGGYAQAQVTYMGSMAFEWVKYGPLAPNRVPNVGWAVNTALAALPALFAVRCVLRAP